MFIAVLFFKMIHAYKPINSFITQFSVKVEGMRSERIFFKDEKLIPSPSPLAVGTSHDVLF